MNLLTETVDKIIKSKTTLSNEFGEYSKVYHATTENIKGFLTQFDLTNKKVLTVQGSCDQLLNAYSLGADSVTCFDINPLSKNQANLKIASMHSLTYEEYVDYFFNDKKMFDIELYKKIRENLDEETKELYDYLYLNYQSALFKVIYYNFKPDINQMKRMNEYLDEEKFYKLAEIIKHKHNEFIKSDVTDLREHLEDRKFDFILLSNISDSIEQIYDKDSLKQYKRLIHGLSKNLNKYGIIQVGYIYDYYSYRNKGIFSNKEERQKIFTTDEFHTTFVESYRYHDNSDAVITYQKLR